MKTVMLVIISVAVVFNYIVAGLSPINIVKLLKLNKLIEKATDEKLIKWALLERESIYAFFRVPFPALVCFPLIANYFSIRIIVLPSIMTVVGLFVTADLGSKAKRMMKESNISHSINLSVIHKRALFALGIFVFIFYVKMCKEFLL